MPTPTRLPLLASMAAAALSLAAPAVAQDRPGLYISAYGGASSLASTSVTESRPSQATITGKTSFGSGTGAGGAVGYRYGNGWAAELAWDYRSHKLQRIGDTPVTGEFASTVAFVNGYYRFAKLGGVRPFIGAGLGYVTEVDMDLGRNGSDHEYSGRGGLATQVMVGGEVDLSDRWSLSADLRWSQMGKRRLSSTQGGSTLQDRPTYQPTSLNVGLTYRF